MKVTYIRRADGTSREFAMYDEGDKFPCPYCKVLAVVPLTPAQRAAQPDSTTHVCHPSLGGCNQGFTTGAADAQRGN